MFCIELSNAFEVSVSGEIACKCLYLISRPDQNKLVLVVVVVSDDVGLGVEVPVNIVVVF